MIETIKNDEGDVLAYIEFEILNAGGQFQNQGRFIYVQDLYITPRCRGTRYLKRLIQMIHDHPHSEYAEYVYWNREKYDHRISKLFSRNRASKRGVKNVKQREQFSTTST